MNFSLDQDQLSIKESARRFFSEQSPVSVMRRIRDEKQSLGYDPNVWQQMIELGYSGMTIPEELGGLGLGYMELGAVFEEIGRTLNNSPLFSSLVLCATVLELCESNQQLDRLQQISQGDLVATLAIDERTHHAPAQIDCTYEETGSAYVISGNKSAVINASSADGFIVVAKKCGVDEAGLSCFWVDSEAQGLSRQKIDLIDSRDYANLTLNNVMVSKENLIGREGLANKPLAQALDRARAILAAEMLGGCEELFARTVDYLKTREQFGVKIGTFQALQHRASKLFIEIELTRSAVYAALASLDSYNDESQTLVALAKAKSNDTYILVSNEAIQMHGGIGVTDELDLGLFLKRARVAVQAFGSSAYQRNQFARYQGY